jgi:hypothetical protein
LTRPLAIIHRRHVNLERAAARFLELLKSEDESTHRSNPVEPSQRVPAATSS